MLTRSLCGGCLCLAALSAGASYRISPLLSSRRVGLVTRCSTSSSSSSSEAGAGNGGGVSALRKEYSKTGLDEHTLPSDDPYALFQLWFDEACAAKVIEPNAMCLSTCKDNRPSARYVLLKGHDERGFVWYTNYTSRKAAELAANPNAALTFWWGDLERSIRIEGSVEQVSAEESDAYFHSRPKGSQLGAWTSNQSSTIDSRETLEAQESAIIAKFEAMSAIHRPPHWGGFRLVPSRVEFWKGRESRLHDRIVFERKSSGDNKWTRSRLQP